jgi:hypothetical protein
MEGMRLSPPRVVPAHIQRSTHKLPLRLVEIGALQGNSRSMKGDDLPGG